MKETPKIFNAKLFHGYYGELKTRMKNDSKEYDELNLCDEANRYHAMFISIFDYVLAWRLNMIPYDDDEDSISFTYCNYTTMSIPMLQKWLGKYHDGDAFEDSVFVHEDLFYGLCLHPDTYYILTFMPSEEYKICCMQWDSYYNLLDIYRGHTQRGRHLWMRHLERVEREVKRFPKKSKVLLNRTMLQTTCAIDMYYTIECKTERIYGISLILPDEAVSDFGKHDSAKKRFNRSTMPRAEWIGVDMSKLSAATYPYLRMSETYLSDALVFKKR